MTRLKLTPEQEAFLNAGNVVAGEWFNIPHWFKKVDAELYEVYTEDEVPDNIRKFFEDHPFHNLSESYKNLIV